MSLKAYQKAAAQAEAPRETEYRVFARVTAGLVRVAEDPDVTPQSLVFALDLNRRLWTALAIDCGDPENKLPVTLRAQIISLSIWVGKHSGLVVQRQGDIADLIEVNRAIMQGLSPGGVMAGVADHAQGAGAAASDEHA